MRVTSFNINISSTDPDRLFAFWRDTVGLAPNERGDAVQLTDGVDLLFSDHSEITGPTQEPARVLMNLFVDDVRAEQTRLEAAGVRFIRTEGREFWGGVISTFVDPDGNYCQLIEYRPE